MCGLVFQLKKYHSSDNKVLKTLPSRSDAPDGEKTGDKIELNKEKNVASVVSVVTT